MVADTCLSNYQLQIWRCLQPGCLTNPVWLSMGRDTSQHWLTTTVTGKRPLVVSGDGGFQMIAHFFDSGVKMQIPCIIAVIDNGLYGINGSCDKSLYTDPARPSIGFNSLNRKYEVPQNFWRRKGFRGVADTTKFTRDLLQGSL